MQNSKKDGIMTEIVTNNGSTVSVEVFEPIVPMDPIKQWDIRYIDLGDADESERECGKSRPCVIIQDDEYNKKFDARYWVFPLSTSPMYNCHDDALIGIRMGDDHISIIGLNHIISVARNRIQRKICEAPELIRIKIREYLITRLGLGSFISNAEENDVTTQELVESFVDTGNNEEFIWDLNNSKFTPTLVRTKSINWCRQFCKEYDTEGEEFFECTNEYNAKTFKAALTTARQRVKLSEKQ